MSLQWRTIAGGWYGAMTPNGAYAVQVHFAKIQTDKGLVDLPPGEPWGVQIYDIADDGRFAGLAHSASGSTLEYVHGAGWHSLEYVTGRGKYAGARWVDMQPAGVGFIDDNGQPVSRILTFEAVHGLNNWIFTDGLLFGQGNKDKGAPCEGLVLWDGTAYRQLFAGSCMELVLHRAGDQFAFAFREDGVGVHLGIFTRQQLLAEPIVSTTPPQPPKEPPVPTFANHIDVVERERAKYGPTIGDPEAFAVTNAVALDPAVKGEGWGLCKAPAGGHGWVVNGQNYRVDKLCHPQGFINDILGAMGEKKGTAQWGPNADPNGNPSNWAPAIGDVVTPPSSETHRYDGGGNDTGTCDICGKSRFDAVHVIPEGLVLHIYDGGEQDTGLCDLCQKPKGDDIHVAVFPPPPPHTPPPSDDLAKLRAEMAELRTLTLATHGDLFALEADVQKLTARVEQLEHKKPDPVTLPKLHAKGELRLTFARTQQIDLPVVQE